MAPNTAKPTKKSLVVTLRISSDALSQLSLSSSSTPSQNDLKKSESDSGPQADEEEGVEKSEDNTAQTNGGPVPEKKKRPQPSGRKRAPPSIDPNGTMRERARPGPKKKPRLADGSIDRINGSVAPAATTTAVPAHKLGPKANTGAINAGLRALDRSGKPCRRWEKKGLVLKSFTGMSWNMSSWKGSARPGLTSDGEVKSDSSSDVKPLDASAVPSEKSAGVDGDTTIMNGIESSPAPPVAA